MSFSVQALNWIKLLSVRGISESEWMTLRKRFNMKQLVEMVECREGVGQLSMLSGNRVTGVDNKFIDKHIDAASKNILEVVTVDEDSYPGLLREINNTPPVLFFRGKLPGHKGLNIAMVGSRSAGRISVRTSPWNGPTARPWPSPPSWRTVSPFASPDRTRSAAPSASGIWSCTTQRPGTSTFPSRKSGKPASRSTTPP